MRITEFHVTPIALGDPPLLNAAGLHAPYCLRTVVELVTDGGLRGLAEVPGSAAVDAALAAMRDTVIGSNPLNWNALRAKLAELGYTLSDAELKDAFARFKEIADKKKQVTVLDLEALVSEEIRERQDLFTLRSFVNQSGSSITPTSQVEVEARGELKKGRSFSNGTVESVFAAIDDAVGISGSLADYQVRAISAGKDSLAEVRVAVEVNGRSFNGQAVSFDVMEASAKAYVRAVNNAAAAGEV